MNLPNKLTLIRLLLTAIFVAVISVPDLTGKYTIGSLLFITASLTDFLDGYLARKMDLVTDFGKLMDPLVDKILISAVFIMLTGNGLIPAWVTIVIISREFLVTGLRLLASSQGAVLMADSLGKWKTVAQIVAATYYLVHLGGRNKEVPLAFLDDLIPHVMGQCLLWFCVLLTIVSGLSYMRSNRHLIQSI
ncbi:MAG: CDP-diacylglycerol--glycerol-3-phosphate 3-phosphatidyltransferase [Verrucomicrobiaceae bacterium]|nr:CDP-diacylglycerol--glycerol-3-phosphate 3-phosphatidyltransferase [Verrucomicrobiaceae bacterium]